MQQPLIRRHTLVNQVMDRIRELIAAGTYAPGDRIPTEQELAAMFGVGRSSIREAIKIFNYLGIMESKAALGTFISERSNISQEALTWALLLGKDDVEMLIEVRGAIELWSFIRITVAYRSDPSSAAALIGSLEEVLTRMETAIAAGDHDGIIKADYDFHDLIITGSGNRLFKELYEVLRSFLMDEIRKSQAHYTDRSVILSEHTNLLRAITSGDVGIAEACFTRHIENIKSLIVHGIHISQPEVPASPVMPRH